MYKLYVWKPIRTDLPRARGRGKCIGEFKLYKDLVAEAQRRARLAGYPKSRWMDLFDWSL